MARSLGALLPADLRAMLASVSEGSALLLLSMDHDGWPRQAVISTAEVHDLDDQHLRLGLWPASKTTRNLTTTGRATLTTVAGGIAYSVRLAVERQRDLETTQGEPLACFAATVEEVTVDEVPYAELTTGVTFRLRYRQAVQRRWERTQAALREPGSA